MAYSFQIQKVRFPFFFLLHNLPIATRDDGVLSGYTRR